MNREEQLQFCRICKNQKFDMKQGIICGLRNAVADFEDTCPSFEEDTALKEKEATTMAARNVYDSEVSKGTRFANRLIDYIFILVFGFVIGIVWALVSPDTVSVLEEGGRLMDYVFGIIIGMIYYTLFEMITSRTLGKLITGTKVVDEEGNTPDAGTILVRSLCRYIPFDAFSFLGDGPGWHDTLSKTRVVKA